MAGASGTEPEEMEVDSHQNTSLKGPVVLIRGLPAADVNVARKAQKGLQSLCHAFQLGEVGRVSCVEEPGCLQVEFSCREVVDCFKNLTLEIDGESHRPASNGAINSLEFRAKNQEQRPHGSPSALMSRNQNAESQELRSQSVSTSQTQQTQFNPPTAIEVDLGAINPALQGRVFALSQLNKVTVGIPLKGTVRIEGLFEDMAHFHEAVIDLLNNDPSRHRPHGRHQGAVAGHVTATEAPDSKPHIADDQGKEQLKLSVFQYEYLSKVCADEISAIKKVHQVDILPEVVLNLQAREHGGLSNVTKALETLTKSIQPRIVDLGQQKITVSEADRPNVARAFRRIQEKEPFFTLTEVEEEYVITGPRSGLPQVTEALMDRLKLRAKPKATLTIQNEMTPMMTAMDIPKFHWELLENLFQKELGSIKSKYKVEIQPHVPSSNGRVQIQVKTRGGPHDLSGNALKAFATLYQEAVTKCIRWFVEDSLGDRVRVAYDEVKFKHPGVRLIPAKGDGLCLIGLPQHVALAVREIQLRLGRKAFSSQSVEVEAAGGQSASSVAALEAKATAGGGKDQEEDTCPVCMDNFNDKMTMKCKHSFCRECWAGVMASKPECPICKTVYGKIEGNQPEGTMTHRVKDYTSLPGFAEQSGTIEIQYHFPGGTQSDKHPQPGQWYSGTTRTAYLPNNAEGREVLRLLRKAFDQKLTFTIGDSRTTGATNTVTWNDIHHKTSSHGGPTGFGYPDPEYLKRVKEELRTKGIE